MSHGIMEHDKGFVYGTTWHNLAQYVTLTRPVTIEEAETVLDYDLQKVGLYRINASGDYEKTGCYGIVRTDKDIFLTDGSSVGNRFTVESNLTMLRRIDEFILSQFPGLIIESVGTLFNGQTAFVNLRVSENQIKGDKSSTETNLMYCNPIGKGSYLAYAHSTRVVCNNTLNLSKVQGEANKSLRKFSHTINAGNRIQEHLIDLSKVFLALEEHNTKLNALVDRSIKQSDIDNFLATVFSAEGKTDKGKTIASNNQAKFLTIYEAQKDTMTMETLYSAYGLLQAYTDFVDHESRTTEKTDEASVIWDSITGNRAAKKEKAFEYLLTI